MILKGDCIEVMKALKPNSIDAIVTDPPYGLEFMGKEWDKLGATVEPTRNSAGGTEDKEGTGNAFSRGRIRFGESAKTMQLWHTQWLTEAYRVLKPGGSMLVMGGTRTFHRLMVAIEDTGFIIKDTIMHIYGSGFPKAQSLDGLLEKKYGKQATKYCLRCLSETYLQETISTQTTKRKTLQSSLSKQGLQGNGEKRPKSKVANGKQSCVEGGSDLFQEEGQLSKHPICESTRVDNSNGEERRLHNDTSLDNGQPSRKTTQKNRGRTPHRPQSEQQSSEQLNDICLKCGAQILRGLKVGGIKPSFEPIVWAVKPPEGSYIDNVLKWGVGAVNVDECRVNNAGQDGVYGSSNKSCKPTFCDSETVHNFKSEKHNKGRFPANIILDEEAGRVMDEQSGYLHGSSNKKSSPRGAHQGVVFSSPRTGDKLDSFVDHNGGGASRFFYCAKASRGERNRGLEGMEEKSNGMNANDYRPDGSKRKSIKATNSHPTVKPIALFEYLIKLVTREGQIVLDPFLGSGTTAIAAYKVGRECVGIEREDDYVEIAKRRIGHWESQPQQQELRA